MDNSMLAEINRLQQMTVAQLRVRWQELYGEESRSRNKEYLFRRCAWRVQELALGGLRDETKQHIFDLAPATFVRSQIPAGFQPRPNGASAPPGAVVRRRDPRLPSPGATLVRQYKGNDIRVLVMEDGFEWDGRHFDSLSEVALAVTGSKWNGWLFFGLTDRKRAR